MDLEQRVQALEQELRILKGQVYETLQAIRAQLSKLSVTESADFPTEMSRSPLRIPVGPPPCPMDTQSPIPTLPITPKNLSRNMVLRLIIGVQRTGAERR